jgi:hypothetical protein
LFSNFKQTVFAVPTVEPQDTNTAFILSLDTDPLSGPYNSRGNVTIGLPFIVRANQVAGCGSSQASVLFGDGSPAQPANMEIGVPCIRLTRIYGAIGTYTITGTVKVAGRSMPTNTLTVDVIRNKILF